MHYHVFSVFFLVVALPIGCFAVLLAPPWDDMKVKHAWQAVPDNWEILGIPSPSTIINLHLALKPHHEKGLVTALYEVSSPGHSKHVFSITPLLYGLHLSKEQVAELVMPHSDTLELVKSWLKFHGVPPSSISVTHGGNWLTLTGVSVSKANGLLGASYQLYQHAETKENIIRTLGYSLPAVLHGHVQTVVPTTHFASPRTSRQTPRNRADDDDPALPFLRWLYNSVTYVPAATNRNMLGITGFGQEYPNPVDLITVNNGGYDPSKPGLEASVDIQYTSGMAYPTPIVYYSVGTGPEGVDDDTSYAWYEAVLPPDYARTLCDLFMQLGARGVSVLVASGDDGVGQGDCMTNDNVRFRPMFPASCPWVTSVGGTEGGTDSKESPEVAADISGGGFSEYFKRPDYQEDVVVAFFKTLGNQYHGLYNATSRGFPDVAAQALFIGIILGGEYEVIEGTSCSAPIVAGIISLLNDFRISQGKRPLGFLNLLLYGIGRAGLNDITSGSNPGCNTNGFSAVVGWDPVLGR
ncbi:subtilisin-like protein [Lactarius vividus]|nr:subtilisin-like protein [Lactarius vividus]